MHSLVASPFKSAYNAAKHGVAGFTKTAALEVRCAPSVHLTAVQACYGLPLLRVGCLSASWQAGGGLGRTEGGGSAHSGRGPRAAAADLATVVSSGVHGHPLG